MWYVMVDGVRVGDGEGFVSGEDARAAVVGEVKRLWDSRVPLARRDVLIDVVRDRGRDELDGLLLAFPGGYVSVVHRRNSDPGGYVVPGRGPGE